MDNVLPRGRFCRLDVSEYLDDSMDDNSIDLPDPMESMPS